MSIKRNTKTGHGIIDFHVLCKYGYLLEISLCQPGTLLLLFCNNVDNILQNIKGKFGNKFQT